MLFWKLFAAVCVLVTLAYWRDVLTEKYKLERFDLLWSPVDLLATAGVVIYAFSLPSLPAWAWLCLFPLFIASVAAEMMSIVRNSELDSGTWVGLAVALLLAGFTAVAVSRLAEPAWNDAAEMIS